MSKPSEAKKKRRQKRLEDRKKIEKINQTLALLSGSIQMITEKLKKADTEFASVHSVFENLKSRHLNGDLDNAPEEQERFQQASEIVFAKTLKMFGNSIKTNHTENNSTENKSVI